MNGSNITGETILQTNQIAGKQAPRSQEILPDANFTQLQQQPYLQGWHRTAQSSVVPLVAIGIPVERQKYGYVKIIIFKLTD